MDDRYTLSSVTMQLSLACCICTLLCVTMAAGDTLGLYYPMVLIPYAPILYGINCLFLRKERTLQSLFLLNACFCSALIVSILVLDDWKSFLSFVVTIVLCIWPTLKAAQYAQKPPALHEMILSLDASMVLLLLFAAYTAAMDVPMFRAIPPVLAVAASILGVISRRISHSMGAREWGLVSLVFLGVFATMWLLVSFAAAPAGEGLVSLWHGFVAASLALLNWLWQILERILSWLMPETDSGELPLMPPSEAIPGADAMTEELSPLIALVPILLAAALVVALVVWLLVKLGRIHVGGVRSAKTTVRQTRQRLSLRDALARFFRSLAARIRLQVFLWKNRNTPQGVFYLLVQRCRKGPWHRQTGETPREFLCRLQSYSAERPDLFAALGNLIPAVDRALYASAADRVIFPEARLIRHKMGTAIRRQSLRTLISRLRERRKKPAPAN